MLFLYNIFKKFKDYDILISIESSDKMRKGFTLIELLAVIVVLAIIALITIPAVLRITENAKISSYRRSIDLYGRAINTAVMAYKSDMVEKKQPINVNFDNVIPYVDYEGYDISCEISKIYSDDTVLLTKCSIEKDIVYAEKVKGFGIENYYYYTNSKKRIKALLYVEAVNKSLQGKNVGTTCEVTSEGNVRCNNQTIEITGELGNPKSGTLYIENNQVTRYSNLKFEDEKAQTQQEVAQVVDEQQINTNPNNDNNNNQNNNGNNNQNNQENNNNNNNQQNNNTPKYATLVEDKNGNGEPDRGDKYTYKVNATDTFTFYVLSIEGTGENQKVNLIMDRNICNDGTVEYTSANYYCKYAWESNNVNVNGPITAMTALGNGTRNWDNVSNMNLNYSDEGHESNSSYGYTGMTITNGTGYITTKDGIQTSITLTDNKPIKSRLPKFSEIYKEQDDDYCNSNRGSCPAWLVKNLCYNERGFNSWCTTCKTKYIENKTNGITNIYGYWLLSSDPGNSNDARSVYYSGYVFNDNPAQASNYGLRPVITVSLSDLS